MTNQEAEAEVKKLGTEITNAIKSFKRQPKLAEVQTITELLRRYTKAMSEALLAE